MSRPQLHSDAINDEQIMADRFLRLATGRSPPR
jgi:hypothetical protein